MTSKVSFSEYQKAIFSEVANGTSNIVVNAVAGSGKTFTIVNAAKQLALPQSDVLFLAFNKSIVTELEGKLFGVAEVKTTHSFGMSVISKGSRRRPFVDGRKYGKLIAARHPYAERDEISCALDLFDKCRVELVMSGNLSAIEGIARHHNIVTFGHVVEIVSDMLSVAYKPTPDGKIDFTDMLVLACTYYQNFVPSYKIVFIDECQDLNTAQRTLMTLAARGGRFVAVGDPKQAINGFAGADCDSFAKLAQLPNTIELPLSVNYRCGKTIVSAAQSLVPQITAHDGAIDGIVRTINTIDRNTFERGSMVLCRKNAPLVSLCYKLLGAGVTTLVKGREIGKGLVTLMDKSRAKTLDGVNTYLDKQVSKQVAKLVKKGESRDDAQAHPSVQAIKDKKDCINAIAEGAKVYRVEQIATEIERIFSDANVDNAVVLSSVHKSKGLEADNVYIIVPNKLPMVWKNQLPWQYEQECNLHYVAITRAKKALTYVALDEDAIKTAIL